MAPTDSDFLYVDPGFVAEGYAEEEAPPIWAGTLLAPGQHATDFREYRRGRRPADWSPRWGLSTYLAQNPTVATNAVFRVEGAAQDLSHRNTLQISNAPANVNLAISWNAPDADTGAADQEVLCLQRFRSRTASIETSLRVIVRGSGSSHDTAAGYLAGVGSITSTAVSIFKVSAGLFTSLASASVAYPDGSWVWIRFRANGPNLYLKTWLDGDAEPAGWTVTTTDATHAAGWVGLSSRTTSHVTECAYFAVATNGGTAFSVVEQPRDLWTLQPDTQVETTARFEYFDPDTRTVGEQWFSSHGRTTGPDDYPANTHMQPLLKFYETLDLHMERLYADPWESTIVTGFGGALYPAIRLDNRPVTPGGAGPLDNWRALSFIGRPIEYRIGKRYAIPPSPAYPDGVLMPHRRFEIISTLHLNTEPDVARDEVTAVADTPLAAFSQTLLSEARNVGIPTGLRSMSGAGFVSIPAHSAYNVTAFVIYMRLLIPTSGATGAGFCSPSIRQTDFTHRQWHVALYGASHATLAHRLHFISFKSDGTALVDFCPNMSFNTGAYQDVIFGVKGGSRWYAYVNGRRVGSGTITGTPHVATGQPVTVLGDTSTLLAFCDHRIEHFVDEEEALDRFSARRDPDSLTISMHRADDGAGAIVTDYATATANHGTANGTDNSDREWVATYLGSESLAGVAMPVSGGAIYHAPTQQIDPLRKLYRFSDRARTAGTNLEIRSKGLALAGGGVAWQEAPAPAAGVADIIGAADEPITFGLPPASESSSLHVPVLVRDDLVARGIFNASNTDFDSFTALRTLLPYKAGYFYPSPPNVADFLRDMLGAVGAFHSPGRDARTYAGALLPTCNPGPWGHDMLLEFLGYPGRGVTLSSHPSYNLTQTSSFSLQVVFKLHRPAVDLSTSGTFTHFPQGVTLIDRTDASAGFYVGIDGRDGYLIFGAPGVTGATTGLHYLKIPYLLKPGTWYAAHCVGVLGSRSIKIFSLPDGASSSVFENTSGLTPIGDATGAPLKIGHGTRGSFAGAISYVIGASGPHSGTWFNTWPTTRPEITADLGGDNSTENRFWIELRDGQGDFALEQVTGRYARVDGCRWAPRLILDFDALAHPNDMPLSGRRLMRGSRAEVRYRRNYSPLEGATVAGGVTDTEKLNLKLPYRVERAINRQHVEDQIRTNVRILETPLYSTADAAAMASLLRNRRTNVEPNVFELQWDALEALRLAVSDEVLVYESRFPDLAEGLAARVVFTQSRGKGSVLRLVG